MRGALWQAALTAGYGTTRVETSHRLNLPWEHFSRLRPRMHDHRTGYRFRVSNEQRLEGLCDPGERAAIGCLSLFVFVEDADRGHGVVACIDDVIGHEALDLGDRAVSNQGPC